MSKEVMSFEKFKYIMETLLAFEAQKDRINDFFEAEIATESWFMCTLGNKVLDTLVNLLADEFNCWFSWKDSDNKYPEWWTEQSTIGFDNDISYWLYPINDSKKEVIINGETIDITSLEDFYTYLVDNLKQKI